MLKHELENIDCGLQLKPQFSLISPSDPQKYAGDTRRFCTHTRLDIRRNFLSERVMEQAVQGGGGVTSLEVFTCKLRGCSRTHLFRPSSPWQKWKTFVFWHSRLLQAERTGCQCLYMSRSLWMGAETHIWATRQHWGMSKMPKNTRQTCPQASRNSSMPLKLVS